MKYLTTALDTIPWVRHGFFTRQGDTPEDAARILGLAPEKLVRVKQVHSAIALRAPFDGKPEADAIVTDQPQLGLAVVTADCAPVLLASRKVKIIAAAHAGWHGAIGGVLDAAVTAMNTPAADIVAAIGPCIAASSYEVGEDFHARFMTESRENSRFFGPAARAGHFMFDLPAYVAARLKRLGIAEIHDTRTDTLSNEALFHSYRRSTLRGESGYGRQISAITIT